MKRGVKQKYCEYLLLLNLFGGIGLFAIYPYFSQQANGSVFRAPIDNIIFDKPPSEVTDTVVFQSWKNSRLVKVVIWTNYFEEHPLTAVYDAECPVKCQFTSDRTKTGDANAVVFHSRDIKSDDFPADHPENQIWVFLNQESPVHTGPNLKNFPNVFNWTMTYRRDSDVYHPYGETIPVSERSSRSAIQYLNPRPIGSYLGASIPYNNISNIDLRQKDKVQLIAWVVSNCNTQSQREELVNQLKQYIPIDVFGNCGDRQCQKDGEGGCFPEIEKKYKFYLSFENSLCSEYISEKFFRILNYSIVPVVYGADTDSYSKIAPPGSFINALDFNTTEDLANYLRYLDKHPEEYLKYFKWKAHYKVISSDGWCSLCAKLLFRDRNEKKWYTNLWRWWNFKSNDEISNYQIIKSKTTVPIHNVINGSKNVSPFTANDIENLSPMCLKPAKYPQDSVVSKLFKSISNVFN